MYTQQNVNTQPVRLYRFALVALPIVVAAVVVAGAFINASPGVREIEGHEGAVYRHLLTNDAAWVVSTGADKTVRIFDLEAREQLEGLYGHEGEIVGLGLAPDGDRIVSSDAEGHVIVWDVVSREDVLTLDGHKQRVECVGFSPSGDRIVTGSYDSTARIWDAVTGEHLKTFRNHLHAVNTFVFSPEGDLIVSADSIGYILFWNAQTLKEVRSVKAHSDGIHGILMTADGSTLLSAGRDGSVAKWDMTDGSLISRTPEMFGVLRCIAVGPEEKLVAVAGLAGKISVLNMEGLEPVAAFHTGKGHVYSLQFTPDGRYLISSGQRNEICLWDVADVLAE